MENQVDFNRPVKQVLDSYPELLDILVDLGFKPLANPAIRQSVGKVVTLKQGCKLINLPLEQLVNELQWNGYTVIGGDVNE
ncbi:DUF1858 domain-containing protein [Aerococcus urinaeequi]|uniref:DUF1858 domain-containing protein n=1 Tax=Aerococcus urinaeequi TaxID=51665 RepID=A0A7M1KQK8_9LACT|nr:DUF1858 domain-containing protein [Aerococcus urinaeequi]QOQ78631.1 DUF1858 domain-containing protein [Aerococcus urinaeequi]